MKKQFKTLLLLLASASFVMLHACKEDDHHDHDDNELITTVRLEITDTTRSMNLPDVVFSDPDGPGGNAPTRFDTIELKNGSVYMVLVKFIDESKTPAHDLTHEIKEEAKDHIICFTASGVPVNVKRTDSDGTYEIGLESIWETTTVGTGKLKLVLKHQPGVKNGQCDPGDSDVELEFPIIVR